MGKCGQDLRHVGLHWIGHGCAHYAKRGPWQAENEASLRSTSYNICYVHFLMSARKADFIGFSALFQWFNLLYPLRFMTRIRHGGGFRDVVSH